MIDKFDYMKIENIIKSKWEKLQLVLHRYNLYNI